MVEAAEVELFSVLTAPVGSRVGPVSAPVNAVWLYTPVGAKSANVRVSTARRGTAAESKTLL